MKRKLIEVALPLDVINTASAREGFIYRGNPSAMHKWWAQRPLAACRAVLFASLVDDPSSDPDRFPTLRAQEVERSRLFDIIERLVQWESTSNEVILEEARAEIRRSTSDNPPTVLDPFCGGGSIPLEAQRLGLKAQASDLNPVAVLITKALIEIPPNFAGQPPVHPDARKGMGVSGTWKGTSGLADDVHRYGLWMRDEAERLVGHLYPTAQLPKEHGGGEARVIAWLWARTIPCPNPACGARMPLVKSFAVSTRKGAEAWVEPIVDRSAKAVRFVVRTGRGTPPAGTMGRQGARCLVCETPVRLDYVRTQGRAKLLDAQLMAIVAEGLRSRIYLDPTSVHEAVAGAEIAPWGPDEEISTNSRHSTPPGYGMTRFRDLFTQRQLVMLTTFSDLLGQVRHRIDSDATMAGRSDSTVYADAVTTYLAFALDKTLDYQNSLSAWYAKEGRTGHLFNKQSLPMAWDFVENNPFADVGGGFRKSVEIIAGVFEGLPNGVARGSAVQGDASSLARHEQTFIVSTDPPYYDNVPYADLSDFFYVWLRRTLGSVYPDLFRTILTPKAAELVADAARFDGDKTKADDHFESGLARVFHSLGSIADPSVPITVYYAFKQAEVGGSESSGVTVSTGWEKMLAGLLASGLSIHGTWPLRTERLGRMRDINSNALASSIVLVCRRRPPDAGITDRRGFLSALKAEMPIAVRTLQHGNVAPVDLAQASIGPGMAIFSRYVTVVEPDGSPMNVRAALGMINTVLGESLAELEDEFDVETRWAVTWFDQYGHEPAPYDRATVLARARGVGMNGLEQAGIVVSRAGKTRLLPRGELDGRWDPVTDARLTVWEITQHLIRTLDESGESGAADLARKVGTLSETARDLAYRLYAICDRHRWADEALGYNALVTAWPEITRLAASTPSSEAPQQTQLFS